METIKRYLSKLLQENTNDLNLLGKFVKTAVIFIVIYFLTKIINKLINRTIRKRQNFHIIKDQKRAETLINTLKKVVNYFLIFIGIMIALETFGVDTKSIIATAGIGGLAIGFGAQSLVKDLITGFFILVEDQYSVGEHIQVEGYEGIVEDLGVRVSKIRDFSGELHIIPNGNISTVTNKTRGSMRALINVSIAYEEDVAKAIKILEEECEIFSEKHDEIISGPIVRGIETLGDYSVDIGIMAQTKAMEQWPIEREMRKEFKSALERAGIEIPYPKNIIYTKNEE